jgi:hypothetical protein
MITRATPRLYVVYRTNWPGLGVKVAGRVPATKARPTAASSHSQAAAISPFVSSNALPPLPDKYKTSPDK